MKLLYSICVVSLMSFSCQPPADQTPRIGETNTHQEQEQDATSFVTLQEINIEDLATAYTNTMRELMQNCHAYTILCEKMPKG